MRCLFMFFAATVITSGLAIGGEPQQPNEHLKDYGPFIGTWRHEGVVLEKGPFAEQAEKGSKLVVHISWKWVLDKQVVMIDWSIEFENGTKVSGKSLTGWNAADEKIMGGGLNSMGGMGMGTSIIDGKTITSTNEDVDAKGTKSSSKIVIKKKDRDTLIWQAVERTGGDIEGPSPVYEFKRVKRGNRKKAAK